MNPLLAHQQIRTQKNWQARLWIVHSTSKATQRPNLSQILKRPNTFSTFFKRFVENSLAWKFLQKSLQTQSTKIKDQVITFLPTSLRIHPALLVSKISKGGESSSKLVAMDATPRLAHQKKSQFSVRNLGSPKSKSSKSIWKCGENGSVFWMLCGWHVTNGPSLNIHLTFNQKPPGRSQAKSSTTRRDLSTMLCGSPHLGCWRSWVANKDKASVAQWDEVSDYLTWLCLKNLKITASELKTHIFGNVFRSHHWSVFPHMARRFRRKVTQRLRSKAAPWEAFSWMKGRTATEWCVKKTHRPALLGLDLSKSAIAAPIWLAACMYPTGYSCSGKT